MNIRRKISIVFLILMIFTGSFFYLYDKVYLSSGNLTQKKIVAIEKGDNAFVAGEKLSKAGVISGRYYLVFYLWKNNQLHGIVAGTYEFSSGLKIPEVARIITGGEVVSTRIPITFPEGWTAKDMADRLTANGFSGDEFLNLINNPSLELKNKYAFLNDLSQDQTLEGYLFPDTYYFDKDATIQDIVTKMLNNFSAKITDSMKQEISSKKRSLNDIVIMASIIEKEAKFADDMGIVSSVFWNRVGIGQRLQSDATLEYVLENKKIQHDANDLKYESPYNSYKYAGLPPGPVSNPGLNAIKAAIYPVQSDYYYFLADIKTSKTIFSKTFEEHVANKAKYGL